MEQRRLDDSDPSDSSARRKRHLWVLNDAGYSPERAFLRATDDKGHAQEVRVRIPPYVLGELEKFIRMHAAGRLVYTTPADFARDAIAHRLQWWSENADSPEVRAHLEMLQERIILEEKTARYQEDLDRVGQFRERVKNICEHALAEEDYDALQFWIEDLREHVYNYREPFRTKLLSLLSDYEKQIP